MWIRRGNSVLVTMSGTHLYKGNSIYSGDIIATFDVQYFYKGNSTYSGDIIYTCNGKIPFVLLVAIL
jgi:hypothetical protein